MHKISTKYIWHTFSLPNHCILISWKQTCHNWCIKQMSLTNLCIRKIYGSIKVFQHIQSHCQLWCYIQDSVQLDSKSFDPWIDVEILWAIFLFLYYRDTDDIMWATLCYWMNFESVYLPCCQLPIFSLHDLILTEWVGNMIFARSNAIWHSKSFWVIYIFSCDQAALWMVFSVRLSVRLSQLLDYVPIIVSSWNFQELSPRTRVRSMQKVKVRGQRSRSQRSRPNLTVSGL